MGEHGILSDSNHEEIRNFTRCILDDLWTLEQMIRDGKIESGVLRIGAEQEMFLVDQHSAPVVPVREIMKEDPVVVRPETPTLAAIRIMRKEKIGCLPVVGDDNRLVGILTLYDVLALSAGLLEEALDEKPPRVKEP